MRGHTDADGATVNANEVKASMGLPILGLPVARIVWRSDLLMRQAYSDGADVVVDWPCVSMGMGWCAASAVGKGVQ